LGEEEKVGKNTGIEAGACVVFPESARLSWGGGGSLREGQSTSKILKKPLRVEKSLKKRRLHRKNDEEKRDATLQRQSISLLGGKANAIKQSYATPRKHQSIPRIRKNFTQM